jgi:hypothetical protein
LEILQVALSKIWPFASNVPIVDPTNGNPTAYFNTQLQLLLEASGVFEEDIATLSDEVADLDTGKADKTITITAGFGLDGGGNLSADRTIDLNASLDDLNDVDTTGAASGDVLTYDGSDWAPAAPTGGGGTFRGCLAHKAADHVTANYSADTIVNWDTESYDTDNIHSDITSTVTITIASPAVITWTGHTFNNGEPIILTTTGALPTGLTANTIYYIVSAAANTFRLALTPGGAAINTSGTQSGTHTGKNQSRLVVPSGVTKVRIGYSFTTTNVTGGNDCYGQILKNNSISFAGNALSTIDVSHISPRIVAWTPVITVTAGDYFEVALATSDTSITLYANYAWMAMEIIA